MSKKYTHVADGMTWPQPGEAMGEVEWRMRYNKPSREDILYAASVMSAYRQMVWDTQRKRNFVCATLQKKSNEDPNA